MGIGEEFSGFALAAFALTGSPGPANTALAASGAAFGLRRSMVLSAGIIAGVLAVLVITASGLTGLVLAQPILGPAVQIAAFAYMIYLAWAIATAPPVSQEGQSGKGPSFGAGIFLGVGNPKAYAAMAALSSGFSIAAEPVLDVAIKAAALLVIIALVNLAWILLGSVLTRFFRDPATNRAINIGFAVLLLASVAFAFWK